MTYYLSPYDNPRPQAPDEERPFRLVQHRTGVVLAVLSLSGHEASALQSQLENGVRYRDFLERIGYPS